MSGRGKDWNWRTHKGIREPIVACFKKRARGSLLSYFRPAKRRGRRKERFESMHFVQRRRERNKNEEDGKGRIAETRSNRDGRAKMSKRKKVPKVKRRITSRVRNFLYT